VPAAQRSPMAGPRASRVLAALHGLLPLVRLCLGDRAAPQRRLWKR
jgi:hypothetical protein